MKKVLLFGLITSLLILAACGQQQQAPPEESIPEQEEPEEETQEPENATPPAPPQQEENETEKATIDSEVKDMIKKVENNVNSFSYTYVGPPNNKPQRTYKVVGNTIKVDLPQPRDKTRAPSFTHVYLDTNTKTAVGWCEKRDLNRCPNGTVKYTDVDYDQYYKKTPYQWLKDIKSATYKGSGPQYESRATLSVEFTTEDDRSGEMRIVEFYGLPGKITLDNGDTIEFRDLSINSLDEEDVAQPES